MKSSHDYTVYLSREAYDDLVDILNYTFREYGEEQWEEYTYLLDTALRHLKNQPASGHTRQDIPTAYRAWNVGQHVIIYRITDAVIFVVRVLHQRMDFTYKFS